MQRQKNGKRKKIEEEVKVNGRNCLHLLLSSQVLSKPVTGLFSLKAADYVSVVQDSTELLTTHNQC